MKTTTQMVREMQTLRAMTADHADDVRRAQHAAFDAAVAFEETFGFSPHLSPEHAPGWVAAKERVEALEEAPGYYWACSRLRDLETALLGDRNGQQRIIIPATYHGCDFHVVGIGDMPEADPSVGTFIAARIMGLVPMADPAEVKAAVAQMLAA